MAEHGSSPPRGRIWFGTGWTRSSVGDLLVDGRTSTFHTSGSIAWVAHFISRAKSSRLTISLWTVDNGKTAEVWHGKLQIHNPKTDEYADKTPVKDFVDLGAKPGARYIVEYARGSTRLSMGDFYLVK